MFAIKFYLLDCEEILSYSIQDYYWPRSSHLNYFKEPYIPPLREELHVEENTFLEEYVESKKKIYRFLRKLVKVFLLKNLISRLWRRLMKILF